MSRQRRVISPSSNRPVSSKWLPGSSTQRLVPAVLLLVEDGDAHPGELGAGPAVEALVDDAVAVLLRDRVRPVGAVVAPDGAPGAEPEVEVGGAAHAPRIGAGRRRERSRFAFGRSALLIAGYRRPDDLRLGGAVRDLALVEPLTAPAASSLPPERTSTRRRVLRIVTWLVAFAFVLAVCRLCGVDVWGWLTELWDTVTEISVGWIVLGCIFQGLQTVLTALGWYGILRYAYRGQVTFMPVLASYAAGVALNNFLPANIGTLVTMLMYVAIIEAARSPASSPATSCRRSSTS